MLTAQNSYEIWVKDISTGKVIESLESYSAKLSSEGAEIYFSINEFTLNTLDELLAEDTEVQIILYFFDDEGALFEARSQDNESAYRLSHYELVLAKTSSATMTVRAVFFRNTI